MKLVLKIGGAALENPATLQSCVRAIKSLVQDGHQLVVVHGGGSASDAHVEDAGQTEPIH